MRQMSSRSVGCSRAGQLRHGGSSVGKLHRYISFHFLVYLSAMHTQWLLLRNQEHSIDQFEVFRKVVELWRISISPLLRQERSYIVEYNQRWSPSTFNVAYGIEDAMLIDSRNQLLSEEHQ